MLNKVATLTPDSDFEPANLLDLITLRLDLSNKFSVKIFFQLIAEDREEPPKVNDNVLMPTVFS